LTWLRCGSCGHIHTDGYWTPEGLAVLLSRAHASQIADGNFDQKRFLWAPIVQNVQQHLGAAFDQRRSWLDIGCGDGSLVMTAAEFGFDAIGMDTRAETVHKLKSLGYNAVTADFLTLTSSNAYDVVSMADVLEHLPHPPLALRKAYEMTKPGGLVFVSCPNVDCVSWKMMDAARSNPYWIEMEHCHNFSRGLLMKLLAHCGFKPIHYGVNQRYKAGMEILGRKNNT
jgi:2-polyprenyl-3-methyl-5-hydroxy-6-metoxy-1,4-benzoquinol methylase